MSLFSFSLHKFGRNFQGEKNTLKHESKFTLPESNFLHSLQETGYSRTNIYGEMFPSGLKLWKTRLIVWCIAWAFSSFPSLFLFCLKSLQLWWILGHCDGISSVFPLFLDNTINSAPKVKSEGAINSQSGTKQSLRDTGPQRLALNSGDADKHYQPGVVFNVSSCVSTKHTTPRSLC